MWLRAMLRYRRRLSTGNPSAGTPKAEPGGGKARGFLDMGPEGAPVTAAAEENLPLVKPQGNLVRFLGRELRRQVN